MSDSARSVSTALAYVLMTAIATILVSGLLIAGGNFVEDQRADVIETELGVVGQQLAADLASADRLVAASDGDPAVRVRQQRPRTVAGTTYRVTLVATNEPFLRLSTTRPEVTVSVALANTTAFGNATTQGGDVAIVYNRSTDRLVISDGS